MKNGVTEPQKRLNIKKSIMLVVMICALILIGILGSYAFFISQVGQNKNQELSVQAGTMALTFSDGNDGFEAELEFGGSAEKTFTIENTGSLDTIAKINWKNLTNTYLEGSLTYSLSYRDEESNITEVITDNNVPRSETPSTLELANGISIPSGKTYTFTLTITLNYLESTDQTADLNARFSSEFSIEEGTNEPAGENFVQALLAKTNDSSITDYNLGDKGEMFTFSHDATEQTEALTDYRYIGNEPNNYIQFNNETWRIIGVFTVEGENEEKEQRIKIIRDESIGDIAWDSSINEWSSSSLGIMLNGDYVNKGGSFTYTWLDYDGTANNSPIQGLNSTAKSQIAPTKWYLGGNSTLSIAGSRYYAFERGEKTYATSHSGETRSTSWVAKVGIIYPSDYIYTYGNGVDNNCYTDGYNCDRVTPSSGWLFNSSYQWTISPFSAYSNYALYVSSDGAISYSQGYNARGVRPCVYLNSGSSESSGEKK